MRYAHIDNGVIVWERDYRAPPDPATLARKAIVPVVEERPAFDPAAEVLDGPVTAIEPSRVVRRYVVRAKTRSELVADVRQARKTAYLGQLGEDAGDFQNTVGDVFDAVIKKIRAMDAAAPAAEPEFDAMTAAIDAIKANNPRPA